MKKVVESILALIKDDKLDCFKDYKDGKLSAEDFVQKIVNIVMEQLDNAKKTKKGGG